MDELLLFVSMNMMRLVPRGFTWSRLAAGFFSFEGRLRDTAANRPREMRIWMDHIMTVFLDAMSKRHVARRLVMALEKAVAGGLLWKFTDHVIKNCLFGQETVGAYRTLGQMSFKI